MDQVLPYIIKTTSILFILLVYYKLFLRKQTFFRLNRLYLLSALVIAITTPFISIEIKALSTNTTTFHPLRIYMSNLLDEVYVLGNYTTKGITINFNDLNWLAILYWLGVTFFSIRYILAILQIQKIKHRYPHKHFHGITIIALPTQQPAFSFFNNLFISPFLSVEDRHKIFEHEKIHIRQLHSLDLLIAELICISNWFNPLVWIFKNTIIENHEYIADRQVIRRFHTGSYLELLIRQTFKGAFSFTNYFSCSNLKKRTIMMTKKQSRKYWVLSFIPVTAILVTLLYGFTCNKSAASEFPFVIPEFTEVKTETPSLPNHVSQSESDSLLFVVVENMPKFTGNPQKWIAQNIKYPTEAITNKIQGKVFVKFVIEKDGSVSNVKVIRGVAPSLDAEAVRVVKNMPKWTPGTQKGKAVRVSYTLPINFALAGGPSATAPGLAQKSVVAVSDDLFVAVEDMPKFPEGRVDEWLAKNIKYPAAAIEKKLQGKVYVQFIIEKDGQVTSPKVLRGIDPILDQEALRVVGQMPKWQPGKQRGQAVRVTYTLPIRFSLDNK